jgi:glycosyltransferase involved in cell wall biosynthesis
VQRIRVLRIIDRLNVGGPAVQASVLSELLDPDRFDQRLLTGTVEESEGDFVELRRPNLVVERVNGLGRAPHPWQDAAAIARINAVIGAFRPQIVHTHKAKAGLLGRLAAWSRRVPVTVHTFHGHLLHGYFSPAKTRAVVAVERGLARPTTALVAVGDRVRDELLAAGIGQRHQYSVVPPGVDLGPLPDPPAARRALGLPPAGPIVTFVGRLTAVKRPERFVDLAIAVARSHPDACFAIAGDGELADEIRSRARPLGRRMVFLGWRGDVEAVYSASDLVVLTSDNEGMPVSLIEAAASGTPAVTTRVGSAPEVVADGVTGYVTDKDPRALAMAVARLLDDSPLRASMGEAASERAKERFGAGRLASDIATLYEHLASTSTHSPRERRFPVNPGD